MSEQDELLDVTIADLYSLTDTDPWGFSTPDAKPKTGPETTTIAVPPLVEPEISDELTISDQNNIFHRMFVRGVTVTDIVAVQPDVLKLAYRMGRTKEGAWIAFTSLRIATRIAHALASVGMETRVETCDRTGAIIEPGFQRSRVPVRSRPWTTGEPATDVAADEFFYCLISDGERHWACFVPEVYWHAQGKTFDNLNIDHLLGQGFRRESASIYQVMSHDLLAIKLRLDRAGFRENLFFHGYMNDIWFIVSGA